MLSNRYRFLIPSILAALAMSSGMSRIASADMILQTASYNGSTYYLVGDDTGARTTWADAEAFALTLGGHLVTVNDAAENAFLLDTFSATALSAAPVGGGLVSLWLGLNDTAQEGSFVWASGESVTYTNWVPGEPGSGQSDEDFAGLLVGSGFGTPGQWHDIVSDFRFNDVTFGVIEVRAVPEPASLMMLGTGAIGLLGYARRRKTSAGRV